ncbi:hypothetical protein ACFLS1_10565 [Verrucomicrobiota bacterium]
MTSYADQWKDYRRRRWLFLGMFLVYLPGVCLISSPIRHYLKWEHAEMVVALSWMFAFVVVGLWFTLWPCPRCGRGFFATWWFSNQFARKCVHCGLPKWSEETQDDISSNKTRIRSDSTGGSGQF